MEINFLLQVNLKIWHWKHEQTDEVSTRWLAEDVRWSREVSPLRSGHGATAADFNRFETFIFRSEASLPIAAIKHWMMSSWSVWS